MRGIKTILTYHYAIITLLPFLLLLLLSLAVIFPREKNEAETRHHQIAADIDMKIESFLLYQIESLEQVPPYQKIKSILQLELDSFVDASAAINALSYVSAEGIVQKVGLSFQHEDSRHAELEGIDISDSDLFKKVSARNKPVWSDVFTSAISGDPAIAYALPVAGAYLIGEISLETISTYLTNISATDGNLFFITDKNGQVIAAQHTMAEPLKTGLHNLEMFKKISGKPSVTDSFMLDGKEYLGTVSSLHSLGWYSLLATPKDVVYRNAYNSTKVIMGGLLASLLLATFSARLLLKKFSGQFMRLAEHTRELATTGVKEENPVETILEFQQIADSFGIMTALLKDREESLLDALQYLERNSKTFESLYELSRKENASQQEFLDFALKAALKVTDSTIGYIFLLDESEEILTLHSWTDNDMAVSAAPPSSTIFQLPETGLMGEAIRQRKAFIMNDYAADNPLKKGLPAGHLKVSRILNLPVLYHEKIVLLAGVGNKPTDYSDEDCRHLGLIMDAAWLLVQRISAEALLRESEERARQMFKQNDDAIIFFRRTFLQPLEANPAAFTIFKADDLDISRLSPRKIFCRKDLRSLFPLIRTGKREIYVDKLHCRRADGEIFFASIKANIITIDNEVVLFCSFRDISARLKLEADVKANQAKMIQANKMTSLGLLVSSVAHEINNPNQCIGMNAFLLKRIWIDCAAVLEKTHGGDESFQLDGTPFAEVKQTVPLLIDTVADSSRRIDKFIKELLDFVRTKKDGDADAVDINKVITTAVSVLWYQIRSSTEHFSTHLSARNPLATGNGQQLEQVFINMITNALQSLATKSAAISVETDLSPDNSEVIIRFRDEGKGMDSVTLAKLAEPFFSTRQEVGGTGLGVYISANIIKEHQGTMSYDSEPDQGTTVTIRLPAVAMNPDNDPASDSRGVQP